MNKENLNQDENYILNKTDNSLRIFIKKMDVFPVKNAVWLVIIYIFIVPFSVGTVIFISYIATHSFPYQHPDTLAFNLSLVIITAMQLSLFFGYLIIKSRENIKKEMKIKSDISGGSHILPKFFFESILSIFKTIFLAIFALYAVVLLSGYICYSIYAFLAVDPPIENLGFALALGMVSILSFVLTLALWILACFLKLYV